MQFEDGEEQEENLLKSVRSKVKEVVLKERLSVNKLQDKGKEIEIIYFNINEVISAKL